MFVEVTRVAERPGTDGTLERLVARMGPYVNFQAVLARIDFAAINANVSVFGTAQMADDGLYLSCWTRPSRPLLLIVAGRKRRQLEQMGRSWFAQNVSRRLVLERNNWRTLWPSCC